MVFAKLISRIKNFQMFPCSPPSPPGPCAFLMTSLWRGGGSPGTLGVAECLADAGSPGIPGKPEQFSRPTARANSASTSEKLSSRPSWEGAAGGQGEDVGGLRGPSAASPPT